MKIFILFVTFTAAFLGKCFSTASPGPYEAIFNFGDSLSDTGNFLLLRGSNIKVLNKHPYGMTFFKKATGRYTDGRLILDFIAEAYGLPYVQPFWNQTNGGNFRKGSNFAVGAATALDSEFYERTTGSPLKIRESLNVQFGWFKKLKTSLCNTKEECDNYFKKSLFLVGEIGGNDVINTGASNLTKLVNIVPYIVEAITNVTGALIEEGAVELVVPGNLPIGCNAAFLTVYESLYKADYDERGCLIYLNEFALFYNENLKQGLEKLRKKYPHARIIYADYYGAANRLFNEPQQFGFKVTLKACCGLGGKYNVKLESPNCVPPEFGGTVCPDPCTYVNWDGAHLTEAAYRQIAKGLIEGPFSDPPLKSPSPQDSLGFMRSS